MGAWRPLLDLIRVDQGLMLPILLYCVDPSGFEPGGIDGLELDRFSDGIVPCGRRRSTGWRVRITTAGRVEERRIVVGPSPACRVNQDVSSNLGKPLRANQSLIASTKIFCTSVSRWIATMLSCLTASGSSHATAARLPMRDGER